MTYVETLVYFGNHALYMLLKVRRWKRRVFVKSRKNLVLILTVIHCVTIAASLGLDRVFSCLASSRASVMNHSQLLLTVQSWHQLDGSVGRKSLRCWSMNIRKFCFFRPVLPSHTVLSSRGSWRLLLDSCVICVLWMYNSIACISVLQNYECHLN